jgi:hypothetical protein
MLQKTLLIFLSITISVSLFAFEGVIKQQSKYGNSGKMSVITWHIKGDKIKMTLESDGKKVVLIPDYISNTLVMYSDDVQDENGNLMYMQIGSNDIKTNVGSVATGDMNDSKYQNESSKSIDVLSNGKRYVVEFLPSISFDFSKYTSLLKESMEIQALAVKSQIGFPVETTLIKNDGSKELVLKTTSIDEKFVADNEFIVPTSYKKFELPNQN